MYNAFFIYFAAINILGALINIIDKIKAQHGRWRISEKALWMCGILGGAPLSYITMKLIRHKTKHKSFMIIMPILTVADIALLALVLYNLYEV